MQWLQRALAGTSLLDPILLQMKQEERTPQRTASPWLASYVASKREELDSKGILDFLWLRETSKPEEGAEVHSVQCQNEADAFGLVFTVDENELKCLLTGHSFALSRHWFASGMFSKELPPRRAGAGIASDDKNTHVCAIVCVQLERERTERAGSTGERAWNEKAKPSHTKKQPDCGNICLCTLTMALNDMPVMLPASTGARQILPALTCHHQGHKQRQREEKESGRREKELQDPGGWGRSENGVMEALVLLASGEIPLDSKWWLITVVQRALVKKQGDRDQMSENGFMR
ncbi:hypothetical protein UY3_07229 [Chelonia mydas]|uniref:Uncharacterized protein n=1 Tax=Chelonia mydas TaxID=8469 RepID=M7BCC5_CHEMY|nr:hypothetical protein UY3_07229 [Chelonia mydas]